MNNFSVIPQNLAIKAFRDNGFKSVHHALAELIDNSIQAGLNIDEPTQVDVLCFEKTKINDHGNPSKYIDEIVVLDNASGMTKELLRNSLMFSPEEHKTGLLRAPLSCSFSWDFVFKLFLPCAIKTPDRGSGLLEIWIL